MPDPGHFGAANRFGPTVCLKCTASYSTPAHRCFCLLGCENRWSLPNTPPGYWALCTLLSYDSAPFLSCGKFPSGVRQGPVIACHLSGPCPRGPCGAGGLLDLPLVPLCRPRAACAASAGRAGGSWFFNSQPLTTRALARSLAAPPPPIFRRHVALPPRARAAAAALARSLARSLSLATHARTHALALASRDVTTAPLACTRARALAARLPRRSVVTWRSPPRARAAAAVARSLARSLARARARTHARTRSLIVTSRRRRSLARARALSPLACHVAPSSRGAPPPARARGGGRSLARSLAPLARARTHARTRSLIVTSRRRRSLARARALSPLACHVAPSSRGAPPPRARRGGGRSLARSLARALARARTHARAR